MIQTERFVLKPLKVSDASQTYLDWLKEEAIKKYITYAESEHTLKDLKNYIRDKSKDKQVIFLGIFLIDTLEHIGNIKFEPVDQAKGYAILGILIGDKKWRGRGVGYEVICSSGRWLQEKFGIKKILLGVDTKNQQAINAYKKVGFIIKKDKFLSIDDHDHISMVWNMDTV